MTQNHEESPDRDPNQKSDSGQYQSNVNWGMVDFPDPPSRSRIMSAELTRLDYWKLRILGRLKKKSDGETVRTAILTYLNRNLQLDEQRLIVEARTQGKTPEVLIQEILEELSEVGESKRRN